MKKYLPILKGMKLFSSVSEEELGAMLSCLNAKLHSYQKGECVLREGEPVRQIAALAEGELYVQRDDYWGNRTIVSRIAPGETFGESYLAPESGVSHNDVVAVADSTVIFLDARKMMTVCSSACRFHAAVVQNLCFALSEKNRLLVQKMGHLSRRSTREKLISYLSEESKRVKSASFTIPFNRQQLADFLSVDRSAMSNELCKMRREGLLIFEKNRFTLLRRDV